MLPGIPFCCCCEIAEDNFAVDDLATAWDVRTGTPTISGGLLNFSGGTNLAIHNTAAGAGVDAVYCAADFFCSSTTDAGRLIIAYVDDDNYWFLEGKPGATNGTLEIYERSGGANTQRGATAVVSGFTTGNDASFQLCYSDGLIKANARSASNVRAAVTWPASITVASTKAGVGGSEVGTVSFDNFSFQHHQFENSSCPACDTGGCVFCTSDLAPPRVQVDISGIVDNTCADCDTWNGTFILDKAVFGVGICDWSYEGSLCGDAALFVRLSLSGANIELQVNLQSVAGGFIWRTISATDFDCMGWSATSVAGFSAVLNPCDFSGSAVTITALDP